MWKYCHDLNCIGYRKECVLPSLLFTVHTSINSIRKDTKERLHQTGQKTIITSLREGDTVKSNSQEQWDVGLHRLGEFLFADSHWINWQDILLLKKHMNSLNIIGQVHQMKIDRNKWEIMPVRKTKVFAEHPVWQHCILTDEGGLNLWFIYLEKWKQKEKKKNYNT